MKRQALRFKTATRIRLKNKIAKKANLNCKECGIPFIGYEKGKVQFHVSYCSRNCYSRYNWKVDSARNGKRKQELATQRRKAKPEKYREKANLYKTYGTVKVSLEQKKFAANHQLMKKTLMHRIDKNHAKQLIKQINKGATHVAYI